MRGRADKREICGEYCQDHQPVVEQTRPSATRCAAVISTPASPTWPRSPGDAAYVAAIDRIWSDVVGRKLYLTGSVGAIRPRRRLRRRPTTAQSPGVQRNLRRHRPRPLEPPHVPAARRRPNTSMCWNGSSTTAFLSGVSLSGDRFFYPEPAGLRHAVQVQPRVARAQPLVRLLLLSGQRGAVRCLRSPGACTPIAGIRPM